MILAAMTLMFSGQSCLGWGFGQVDDAVEFIIDETFQVAGVGVVVAGTVKRGTLLQGASLLLGPHAGDASFKPTAIKSIAYKRLPVTKVSPVQSAMRLQTLKAALYDICMGLLCNRSWRDRLPPSR